MHAKGDQVPVTASVQEAVHALDPDLPTANYETLTAPVDLIVHHEL